MNTYQTVSKRPVSHRTAALRFFAALFILMGMSLGSHAKTIALYYDNGYVETITNGWGEAYNLKQALEARGFAVNTFTGVTPNDFSAALADVETLIIPELEIGNLGSSLSTDAIGIVSNFVQNGNTLILGADIADNDDRFIHAVFGHSTTGAYLFAASPALPERIGTVFDGGPAVLPENDGHFPWETASLPTGTLSIYGFATNNVEYTTVALIPQGSGQLILLAWDWWNGDGSQDADEWNEVLWRAVATTGLEGDLYVDHASTNAAFPYGSWATAATNIQQAVMIAGDGSTVHVNDGTYLLSSEIVVSSDILIQSVNGPLSTIVDGGGAVRGFNLGSSACTVRGFTITNGYTAEHGGGIYCANITPRVANCMVSGNEADQGGGLYSGTADNCLVVGNASAQGGAGLDSCEAQNCTVVANLCAGSGGGVYAGATRNSIVMDNTPAEFVAGGTQQFTCSPALTHGVNGNITNAPSFMDPSGNYRQKYGSPCINAGSNGFVAVATDLDGAARVLDSIVDMGAYEYDIATVDSDGDLLADGLELMNGLDPLASNVGVDTDSDGLSDIDEVNTYGTDPLADSLFELVATPSAFGMISPEGTNEVIIGRSTNFIIAANSYYSIADVLTNEVSVGAVTNFAWTNVVDDGTINATFAADLATNNVPHWWLASFGYTNDFNSAALADQDGDTLLTWREFMLGTSPTNDSLFELVATAATNGMISPAGTNEVIIGNTMNFVVTPDLYYSVADVFTNGISVGAVTNFTWMNVVDDGAIHVAFEPTLATNGIPLLWLVARGITNHFDAAALDDPDEDLLPTWEEYAAGTDPFDSDSDQDGYTDYQEVVLNGTDPLDITSPHTPAHYVSLSGSHVSPFVSWDTAATNMEAAVAMALSNDTVWVANGTYQLLASLVVSNDLQIRSVNGPESTVVDGGGNVRCFDLHGPAGVISGFTITNGYAEGSNGDGGGIRCSESSTLVTNCVIIGNTAEGRGGGMYGGTSVNCAVVGNRSISGAGGGMCESIAMNCLISGNTASLVGGMRNGAAYNCTIVSNVAGGVENVNLRNCIVWYNRATNGAAQNIIYTLFLKSFVCSPDVPHGVAGSITNEPSFVDLAGGDYRLKHGSPCINAGNNGSVIGPRDLAGAARIIDTTVDMGAYEYNLATADSDGDGLPDGYERSNGLSLDVYTDLRGLIQSNAALYGYVTPEHIENNPGMYGLYSSNAVLDLAVGDIGVQITNGMAELSVQLWQSDDLVTWTNMGGTVYWAEPVDPDKKFFRVRAEP